MDLDPLDGGESLEQLLDHDVTKVGEPVHGLPDKDEDIHGGQLIVVRQELHEERDDGGGLVGELDAGGVEGADQELAVLARVLLVAPGL